jgi:hypothetical protein
MKSHKSLVPVETTILDNGKQLLDCHSAHEYLEFAKMHRLKKDEQAAEPFLRHLQPTYLNSKSVEKSLGFWSPLRKFRAIGPGLYFLLYTLRYFTLVFFVLGMLSLTDIMANLKGGALVTSPGTPVWVKTTIANSAGYKFTDTELGILIGDDEELIREVLTSKNALINTLNDEAILWNFAFIVLFIIAIYGFKYMLLEERLRVQDRVMSVARFAIRITGFPIKSTTKGHIQEFIARFYEGKIVAVHFAYKFNDTLHQLRGLVRRQVMLSELDSAKIQTENHTRTTVKLRAEIDKLNQILTKKLGVSNFEINSLKDSFDKLEAYVVLEDSAAPGNICGLFDKLAKDDPLRMILDRKVQLDQPDDANDIDFEHIEKSNFRKAVNISFIVLLCLVIIAGFLALSLYVEHNFGQLSANYSCDYQVDTFQTISSISSTSSDFTQRYLCFCKYSYQFMKTDEERGFCQNHINSVNSHFYSAFLLIVIIEVANLIIAIVIEKLMERTYFASKSNKFVAIVLIYFSLVYLNTMCGLMISGDTLFGPSGHSASYDKSTVKELIRNINNDFFILYGYKAIILMFFLIVFPHFFLLIGQIIMRKIRDFRAKRETLQFRYIKLKAPFEFALSEYYVLILNLIFCTLTFAAGMPILIVLCFFAFLFSYGCIKFIFVKYNEPPAFLRPLVVQTITKILPFAVIIHLAFAIVIYGNQFEYITYEELMMFKKGKVMPAVGFLVKATDVIFDKCLPLTITLIVFLVLMIVEFIIYKCCKKSFKRYFYKPSVANVRYEDSRLGLNYWSAMDYDFLKQPKYSLLNLLKPKGVQNFGPETLQTERFSFLPEKRLNGIEEFPVDARETQRALNVDEKKFFSADLENSPLNETMEAPALQRDMDVSQFEQSLSLKVKSEISLKNRFNKLP